MNYQRFLYTLALSLTLSGCAVTSGFQTYDLPNEGIYKTDLGSQVNIVKLSKETLPVVQPAEIHYKKDYGFLFSHQTSSYRLSPGDILSIQLWAYPEITPPVSNISNQQSAQANGYQIDQNGYIYFPLINRYKAAGKTLHQINQELRGQLAQYLKTPDAIVRVIAYQGQRFSVQGSVKQGGQFYLNDQPISVYTALGLAGGVTEQGDTTAIQLVRNGTTYDLNTIALEKAGFSLHNLLIQPNDTLYVNSRENQKVYVMGEAGKNQALPMRNQGMTLSDVLGESQGINPLSASAGRIYVLRSNPNDQSTELYHMSLGSLGDFGIANQFKMRSNDIVYIDATGLTRWQRVINQIIPFSSIINTANNLGN